MKHFTEIKELPHDILFKKVADLSYQTACYMLSQVIPYRLMRFSFVSFSGFFSMCLVTLAFKTEIQDFLHCKQRKKDFAMNPHWEGFFPHVIFT